MLFAACDEDDQVPCDINPIDEDDPMYFIDDARKRPELPELQCHAPEGSPLPWHIHLLLRAEEPIEEVLELLGIVVDPMSLRATTILAAPALRTGFGLAVPLHLGTAIRADNRLHRKLLKIGNFLDLFSGFDQL